MSTNGAGVIIFNVYYDEEWEESFLQASFSTRDKAELFIEHGPHGCRKSDMRIEEYELDSEVPSEI